jgi:excisionase family DNA binding protein
MKRTVDSSAKIISPSYRRSRVSRLRRETFLRPSQIAQRIGVSERTVYRYIEQKRIRRERVLPKRNRGRPSVFSEQDLLKLDEYLENSPSATGFDAIHWIRENLHIEITEQCFRKYRRQLCCTSRRPCVSMKITPQQPHFIDLNPLSYCVTIMVFRS